MAARIVHFGVDDSFRVAVLSRAGFEVDDCNSSLPKFADALRKTSTLQAVVLSEDEGRDRIAVKAAKLARSECKAPVILFRSAAAKHDYPDIDLVIPNLTEPSAWLREIYAVIARSHELVAEGESIRRQSAKLAQQTTDLRMQSIAVRKRSEHLRSQAKKNLDGTDSK